VEIKLEEASIRIEFDPEDYSLIERFFPVFKRILEGYTGIAIRTIIAVATFSEEGIYEMAKDVDFNDPVQCAEFGTRIIGGKASVERLLADKFKFTDEELESWRG